MSSKCYIVSRKNKKFDTQELFISTEYPVTTYDLLNTIDTLVATIKGESHADAIQSAIVWLKQQVNAIEEKFI